MLRHNELWRYLSNSKEITLVYISLAIRNFSLSLISLFVPLYLYNEIGYSLEETLMMFLFFSVVFAVSCPVAAKFSAKYGFKHSILLSTPFYILFILFLYLLPILKTPLIILAALMGISLAFFWVGMHPLFYFATDRKKRGEEFGKGKAIIVAAATAGPLIGGLLIKLVGFSLLFAIASVFLFISSIILFFSKDNHVKYNFSVKKVFNKDQWKNSLFFVSQGTEFMANGVLWPLFIFIILGSYLSLGIIGSILAGLTILISWTFGKFSDNTDKHKLITISSSFESLSWFLKSLVITPAQVFAITIFGAITNGTRAIPVGALVYDKTTKEDVLGYFVNREIFICLGRILILSLVLMLGSLKSGLIFQGFSSLAALLF